MTCPVRVQAGLRPQAPALRWGERTWTWSELDAEVAGWVGRLAGAGVGSGDRVALLSRNRPEAVFLFHAVARRGAALAPLNVRAPATELAALVARLRPRWRLAEASLADRLEGAALLDADLPGAPDPGGAPRDGAVQAILFTSGTTGRAKAAELPVSAFRASARASAPNLGGDPDQRWLATLPLFHVGGLAMVARCAEYGAELILQDGFDPAAVSDALDRHRITHLSVVAVTLQRLLDARGRPLPSHIRAVLAGGGPVPPALLARARAMGAPVLQTYGLTEACSQVTTEPLGEADGQTAGVPLAGTRVRIVDGAGAPLPPGAEGEIEVAGPTLMRGYLDDPEATGEAFRGDWLRTRDLGRLDERGRLTVLARRTDLIVSGGENVYPAEIEAVLAAHPAVADAAVLGGPDPEWGQVPWALVVPGSGPLDPEALATWCRTRLAGFKVPRRWIEVRALPRNDRGKLDRRALPALLPGDLAGRGRAT